MLTLYVLRLALGQLNFPQRILYNCQVVLFGPHLSHLLLKWFCDWHQRREFRIILTNFLEMPQHCLPCRYMFCNVNNGLSANRLKEQYGNEASVSRSLKVFGCCLASSGRTQTWAGSLWPFGPTRLKEVALRDHLRNAEILFLWETDLKGRVEE